MTRAEKFASSFPSARAFTAVEDLLALEPDVVHVLTPHFLHREHVEACLKAGCNVLTEKPIATTMEDARSMIQTARNCGRQLGVVFQNRYIEGVQEVRRLIREGAFGRIIGAWSHMAWHRPPSYYQCDWKGSWEKEGGGVVIDQAIHSIDLVRYMMGCEPVEIQGHISNRVLTMIEVEDEADAAIRFENGIVYAFSACNYYIKNSPIRIEIAGENGVALLTESRMDIAIEGREPYTVIPSLGFDKDGQSYWGSYHKIQIAEFYKALDEGRPVPFDPEDASRTLAIVLGIYDSGRHGGVAVKPATI